MRAEGLDKRAELNRARRCRRCRCGCVVAALSSMETPPELQRGFAVPLAPCTLRGAQATAWKEVLQSCYKAGSVCHGCNRSGTGGNTSAEGIVLLSHEALQL